MSEQVMQQNTNKLLYAYWNEVRKDRMAPERIEIEPSSISSLLAEMFIIDCSVTSRHRFRLAGTKICDQLGRELRGVDLRSFWNKQDREALDGLLQCIVMDGAVGVVSFDVIADSERWARFEMTLMPLTHSSRSVNRILGAISAIDPPYWLGTASIQDHRLHQLDLIFPGGQPHFLQDRAALSVFAQQGDFTIVGDHERKFRVFEGGRSS